MNSHKRLFFANMPPNSQNLLQQLQLNKLPTLPHVLVDIINACQCNGVTFQEIADIVSRDASISARVVSMANSSFFNRGTPIRSLDRALLVLGTETIKTIVITATIHQFFSGINNNDQGFLKEFWRRSLNCALLAKSLAILTSYPQPDEAYLCGLLHNMGELVLASNLRDEYLELVNAFPNENTRLKHELGALGIDHAELSALLIEQWGLSAYSVDAVRYHHANLNDVVGAHHLVKILFVSSELSRLDEHNQDHQAEIGTKLFELNPSLVNEIVRKIDEEVEEVASSMGINLKAASKESKPFDEHQANVNLAKAVRDHSLESISHNLIGKSDTKTEFAKQVAYTLSLLFGMRTSAVFWKEDEELILVDEDKQQVPIQFPIDRGNSLVAKAALDGKVLSSFHDSSEALVADQQILRHLASEGMLCMPIHDKNRVICVVVASLHSKKEEIHPSFLDLLIRQLTDQCLHIESAVTPSQSNVEISALSAKVREIAHEANNPLSIINNYLASLSSKLSDQDDVKEELTVLKEELERASDIILRLRDIEQDKQSSEDHAEINLEIKNLLTLYKNSLFLAKQIEYEFEQDTSLKVHPVSRNSLRQILTNLIKNAVEALPEGGKISITTRGDVNVNGQRFTEIRVEDNGPGIPLEIQQNLFSPVSTTKGTGHSGLGLSITKNLVTEARGTITCRSSKTGTQFQVLLPGN